MSFAKEDLEIVVKQIRAEQNQEPEPSFGHDIILELVHAQHCRLATEFIRTIQFHESYCRLEIVPEPGAAYVEIVRNELLLPYCSILAIEKRTKSDTGKGEQYCEYRLITTQDLGQFYEIDEGYTLQRNDSDPTYIESPGTTLSRIYGLLRNWGQHGHHNRDSD